MNWKYSSLGLRSIAYALAHSDRGAEVIAAVLPETRHALQNPTSERWHDGAVVVDVTVAAQRLLGDAGAEQLFFVAVKRSLGPVLEPFLRIALTLTNQKPEALFRRMNDNLQPVMRGVGTEWKSLTPTSGELTVVHQDEMQPAGAFPAWAGSIRYSFDLCRTVGTVIPQRPSPDNRRFTFDLSWTE